ncbi:class E sortase [Candidatus Saccharibacteria bacterium]|nr:class E sortase [Candidatus Saccharibacteria bacterium]
MDSKTGGLSSDDKQRMAAAEIARRKVLLAYEQKEVNKAAEFIKKQDKAIYSSNLSQNRSALESAQQQRPSGVLGTSVTPVLKTVSNEEWKKYHTAWQDYYQKYYSEYYLNAAKEYVAKQQVKAIREEAVKREVEQTYTGKTPAEIAHNMGSDSEEQAKQGAFKARIQEKAMERAKMTSRRKKLIPVFAGIAVTLTILFLQYNRMIFAPIAAYVSPGDSPAGEISAVDPTVTLTKVSAENKLIIPKLNVDVPLNFGIGLDGVMEAMNRGVVHYRINGASAFPGEVGNFVVMGHSAGDIYSGNQYKFIFSGLERLEVGDIMYVHYNSTRYTYKMVSNEIIWPTEVSKLIINTDKPLMTLVTCWPLGTSRQRLLIHAEQISPSTEEAVAQEEVDEVVTEAELPQNEDTLFDRIRKWLFGEG